MAKSMIEIFSVSMPRSGHHVAEMVLRGLMGEAFEYCEFYTVPDCCKSIPCSRRSERFSRGVEVFMQKSHDHQLADAVSGNSTRILVQVREPVARAISNYELDLATVGAPHSTSYLKFWLAKEAAYTEGFFRKWKPKAEKRSLVMHYEGLLRDPVSYFRTIFDNCDLPARYFNKSAIERMQGVSSAGAYAFKQREPEKSSFYDKEVFSQYVRLIALAAESVGYTNLTPAAQGNQDAAFEACFNAYKAMYSGDLERSLSFFDDYLTEHDAHYFGRQQRASVLARLGRRDEAEVALHEILQMKPDFASASIDLAGLQDERGDLEAAHSTLKKAISVATLPAKVYERIVQSYPRRPHLVPVEAKPMESLSKLQRISKEEVVAGFRWILGREPESAAVIEAHQLPTPEDLRFVLISSPEFADKYSSLRASVPN